MGVIPGMEGGEDGVRSRLENLRETLTGVSTLLGRHSGKVLHGDGGSGLVLRRVEAESRLLAELAQCKGVLSRVHRDLKDALAELTELDLKSARRHQEAERLHRRVMDASFRWGTEWDIVREVKETFEYASSPLLRVGGGLYFGPTQAFLTRYAEHAAVVRSLYGQARERCEVLSGFAREALEGPVFRPTAGMSLDRVDELHHSEFEQLVADLLDRDGYRIVRSGGGAGDQGADVIAVDEFGRHIMLQAKHFRDGRGSVGQPVVQHLYGGAMAEHHATLPVVVTNGRFTGGATVWAKERDRVRLVDREGLRLWAQEDVPLSDVLASSP
ncbi:restriction endonuclease [Streptomyces sp. NPDC057494]|uniref:restriction endonuclease n=1 Tax=Streptomyces sp. NPDC057494 TaxID=3346148 RepID=UPI0036AFEE6B